MMNGIKIFIVLALLISTNVNASLMTFETRALDRAGSGFTINNNDLINSWHNQNSVINENNIEEFKKIQSGSDSFSHIRINLALDDSNHNWQFNLGLDAGRGASIYVDNKLIHQRTDDLWWGYNWSNTDVFNVALKGLNSTNKYIDIYWAENCCDGSSTIRFKHDGSDWKSLSNTNLKIANNSGGSTTSTITTTVDIPEPTSLALFGLSFILLGRRLRKK